MKAARRTEGGGKWRSQRQGKEESTGKGSPHASPALSPSLLLSLLWSQSLWDGEFLFPGHKSRQGLMEAGS